MKIADICKILEDFAPLNYQESYDNCGLLIGSPEADVQQVLISLDVTDEVLDEAIRLKCNMIVAHHPLIFSGLKRLSGNSYTERLVVGDSPLPLPLYPAARV